MPKICHALVAKTAKEITAEVWEVCSSNDRFHATWPAVRPFVARFWKDYIGHARVSLAKILEQPMDPAVEAHVKETIYEALCLEGALKEVPMAAIPGRDGYVPTPAEIARYGGLN